jgi:MFS family permease
MLGSYIAIPAGQLAFGPLGAAFGLQRMILFAGVAYAAISLLTLLSRSVWTLDRVATKPDPEVTSPSAAPPP